MSVWTEEQWARIGELWDSTPAAEEEPDDEDESEDQDDEDEEEEEEVVEIEEPDE